MLGTPGWDDHVFGCLIVLPSGFSPFIHARRRSNELAAYLTLLSGSVGGKYDDAAVRTWANMFAYLGASFEELVLASHLHERLVVGVSVAVAMFWGDVLGLRALCLGMSV